MLTCALCNEPINDSTRFCSTCGAPGPGASAEQRAEWRARRSPVGAAKTPTAPAPSAAAPANWPAPPPAAPPTPPPPPAAPSSWPPAPPAAPSSWTPPPASGSPWIPTPGPGFNAVQGIPGKIGSVAAKYVVFAAAAGLILGSFLPWATVHVPFEGSASINGMKGGDGWFTLIVGVVLAVLAFRSVEPITTAKRNLFYVIGAGATAFTLFEFGDAANKFKDISDFTDGMASPHFGVGLFLLLASSIALLVGTWKLNTRTS